MSQKTKTGLKIALSALAVSILDICVFSKGLLAYSLFQGELMNRLIAWIAVGITLIVLPLLIYAWLKEDQDLQDIPDDGDLNDLLDWCQASPAAGFKKECRSMAGQIETFQERYAQAQSLVEDAFGKAPLTLNRYQSVMDAAKRRFEDLMKSMIRRMSLYQSEPSGSGSRKECQERLNVLSNEAAEVSDHLLDLVDEMLLLAETKQTEDDRALDALREVIDNTKEYEL